MKLVGHSQPWHYLKTALGPVTLLLGPDGVGKWTLAAKAAEQHGYPWQDVLRSPEAMTALGAQSITEFSQKAGSTPKGRLVLACLDGAAPAAQNALLKLLEQPPPKVKFILTASTPPLATVVSRCQVIRCGLLTEQQVEEVLLLTGSDPRTARAAAVMSGGSAAQARMLEDSAEPALEHVRKALAAASEGKKDRLPPLFRDGSWTLQHHRLLTHWAAEMLTGRFRMFRPADAPRLSKRHARYAMLMMTALDSARPRILDRAVLETIITTDAK
jgi:hypothetical protein